MSDIKPEELLAVAGVVIVGRYLYENAASVSNVAKGIPLHQSTQKDRPVEAHELPKEHELVKVSCKSGRSFYVIDCPDKQAAADLLDSACTRVAEIVEHLRKVQFAASLKYRASIGRIVSRYRYGQNLNLMELNPAKSNHLAFNQEKGKAIVVCLKQTPGGPLADVDTILFVVLHEVAHTGMAKFDPMGAKGTTNHSEEFHDLELFLFRTAKDMGLMDPSSAQGKQLCGRYISHPKRHKIKNL
jgi:hypothetical protein